MTILSRPFRAWLFIMFFYIPRPARSLQPGLFNYAPSGLIYITIVFDFNNFRNLSINTFRNASSCRSGQELGTCKEYPCSLKKTYYCFIVTLYFIVFSNKTMERFCCPERSVYFLWIINNVFKLSIHQCCNFPRGTWPFLINNPINSEVLKAKTQLRTVRPVTPNDLHTWSRVLPVSNIMIAILRLWDSTDPIRNICWSSDNVAFSPFSFIHDLPMK